MKIPIEIFVYEILTRTCLETIASSRLVSKEINEATYEKRFTQLFYKRANIASGVHILSLKYSVFYTNYISTPHSSPKLLSLRDFLPRNIKIAAATKQGLLLCIDGYYSPKYIVCKPTTQQWRTIPRPKTRFFTQKCMMFTIGSNPLRYKIVRFSSRNLGEKESWKFISLDLDKACDDKYKCRARYQLVEHQGKLGLHCTLRSDHFVDYLMILWIIKIKKTSTSWSLSLEKQHCFQILKEPYASMVDFLDYDLVVTMGFDNILLHDVKTSISKIRTQISIPWNKYFKVESDYLPVTL
ncbi:hypothetical protein G4B88_015733 [Cannabis sativa]|uniref:F-box protein n=1 Tax=Cannabis sativa TaxID=3483 RepID=A0A7J6H6F3_CANSA|nr:hypothetical protein G4B88_010040 [Cannabis sativa]KAF4390843.1 hypothetical protein G4B88_015733 [Cannabis sativa]